ncbi:MAG TPA: ferritin-like domain-containing protein [Candidatus Competibacteraceae bacterium]|nr:ferritin-like domain-containing protein [Candidatus Competibacteraceae bacterium]
MRSLFDAAQAILAVRDAEDKRRFTVAAGAAWSAGLLGLEARESVQPIGMPGRPERPRLVHPRQVPRRAIHTVEGRAALIHAIAHIEFNAINLAWDAVYRFRGMPRDYYSDWVQVACEEAAHFALLRERLKAYGHDYGDFDAHDGLWEMAVKTAHDPLLRMALVPRVLEARGLDVTPGMIERLSRAGDTETVAILRVILRDEVGHVAIGSRWFKHCCAQRGLEPEPIFQRLLAEYLSGPPRGPFNEEARLKAGFSVGEMAELKARDAEAEARARAGR